MNLAHPVNAAGIEQNPFAERSLARINVSGNAYVSQVRQVHDSLIKQIPSRKATSHSTRDRLREKALFRFLQIINLVLSIG
jgi:hypothetical protein